MPRISSKRSGTASSDTVENYLKQIHALAAHSNPRQGAKRRRHGSLVSLGELAAALRLTPGTVTTMVKRLSVRGLVRYERYGGVALTAAGRRAALGVLRRHRLVETFLVRTLGLDWSEVHEEAELLEHVLSERVLRALDRFLGHPAVDPHGDPISLERRRSVRSKERPLAECRPSERVRIERVLDQSPAFLRFASRNGITPGAAMTVRSARSARRDVALQPASGPMIQIDRRRAERILVCDARRSPGAPRQRAIASRKGGRSAVSE